MYSRPAKDDPALSIEAGIMGRNAWQPDEEIAECGFFGPDELPQPMHAGTERRIRDAAEGLVGVRRVVEEKNKIPILV